MGAVASRRKRGRRSPTSIARRSREGDRVLAWRLSITMEADPAAWRTDLLIPVPTQARLTLTRAGDADEPQGGPNHEANASRSRDCSRKQHSQEQIESFNELARA
jgi:hypothetical protein